MKKALEVRKENKCEVQTQRSAFRLVNGLSDGLPAISIDLYGLYAVIHVYSQHWQLMVMEIAKTLMHIDRRVEGVYMVNRTRKSGTKGDIPAYSEETKAKSQCIWGKRAPEHRTVVEENGLLYHVQLDNGPAIGLYMDQRVNRQKIIQLLKKTKAENAESNQDASPSSPRFLNTFCFSGSFSLGAAKYAGAVTTNVDASELALLWAKDNFTLNGLATDDGHEFIKKDVFSALVGLNNQERQFDVILLDPPTISRVKVRNPSSGAAASPLASYVPSLSAQSKTHFSAMENYNDLVALASPLVAPGGYLVCFVNTHSLDKEKWRSSISEGLESIIPRIKEQIGQDRMSQVRAYLRKRGVKVKYRNSIIAKQRDINPPEDFVRDHYGFEIVDEWFQDTSDFTVLDGDAMGKYLHGLVLKRNRSTKTLAPITLPVIKSEMLHESKRTGDIIKNSTLTKKLVDQPFTPTSSTVNAPPKTPKKGPWSSNSL